MKPPSGGNTKIKFTLKQELKQNTSISHHIRRLLVFDFPDDDHHMMV